MWDIVIPIITFLVGLGAGIFGGMWFIKRQMTKVQTDPKSLQKMANKMGYNVNNKQMKQVQQMMKRMK